MVAKAEGRNDHNAPIHSRIVVAKRVTNLQFVRGHCSDSVSGRGGELLFDRSGLGLVFGEFLRQLRALGGLDFVDQFGRHVDAVLAAFIWSLLLLLLSNALQRSVQRARADSCLQRRCVRVYALVNETKGAFCR